MRIKKTALLHVGYIVAMNNKAGTDRKGNSLNGIATKVHL